MYCCDHASFTERTRGAISSSRQSVYRALRKIYPQTNCALTDCATCNRSSVTVWNPLYQNTKMADGGDSDKTLDGRRKRLERLKAMQEHYRRMEAEMAKLSVRMHSLEDECEQGERRIIRKLQTRVRELEQQVDDAQRRHSESQNYLRRARRTAREIEEQAEENRRDKERLLGLLDKLRSQSDTLQRRAEEAEQTASVSMAKYKELEEEYPSLFMSEEGQSSPDET